MFAQPLLNTFNKAFCLPSQLINNGFGVVKAAFALHILQRIALYFLVCGLLLQYVNENLVARIRADSVDYRKREFALGKVFAQPLEVGVPGCRGEVEVVVKDLEE